MVKTSELLRKAADLHLIPDGVGGGNEWAGGFPASTYICWAFCFACLGDKSSQYQPLGWHLKQLSTKHREIVDMIADEVSFMGMHSEWDNVQSMRFMYLDFLAHYFEDLGD